MILALPHSFGLCSAGVIVVLPQVNYATPAPPPPLMSALPLAAYAMAAPPTSPVSPQSAKPTNTVPAATFIGTNPMYESDPVDVNPPRAPQPVYGLPPGYGPQTPAAYSIQQPPAAVYGLPPQPVPYAQPHLRVSHPVVYRVGGYVHDGGRRRAQRRGAIINLDAVVDWNRYMSGADIAEVRESCAAQ